MDIVKFHRTVPVLPDHKPFLVVCDERGKFWVDMCDCFGLASASSCSGMISAAVRDVLFAKGIFPVAKIEDDLAVFRTPLNPGADPIDFKYAYDRESVLESIQQLGTPFHSPKKKGDPFFIDIFIFIGLLWDMPLKRVSLPDVKRLKYLHRIRTFLQKFGSKSTLPVIHTADNPNTSHSPPTNDLPSRSIQQKAPLNEVEKLHGTLCYVTFVYTEGRSHLPAISNFMSSYRGRELESGKFPTTALTRELLWWLDKLSDPSFYRQLRPRPPLLNLEIYADASTEWGIGFWIQGHWAAFQLTDTWKIEGRDICWLETLAIELVIYFLEAMGFHDAYILIHSDNQGTIGAMLKERSPNRWINLSVRRTFATLTSLLIEPKLVYIASADNPADSLSRGVMGSDETRIPYSISLPDELIEAIICV